MARERKARRGERGRASEVPTVRENEWRELIRQWEASGVTQGEFCRQRSVSRSAFGWWRSELRRRDRRRRGVPGAPLREGRNHSWGEQAISFVPVEVVSGGVRPAGGVLEIVLRNERRIRVSSDFDAVGLERLVGLLERVAC